MKAEVTGLEDDTEFILDEITDFILTKSMENLEKYDAIDTGFLLRSGKINSKKKLAREILWDCLYADFVEYGREPGKGVPIEPLTKWVQRRIGVKNIEEARSIAFAISRSIKYHGLKARPYVRDAIKEADKFSDKITVKLNK